MFIWDTTLSIETVRLGFQGELGVLVAGFHQVDAPGQTERLVLAVAANRAAIGLQKVRQLSEQRRMVNDVDQMVALRTADLAAANAALTEELAERRRTEENDAQASCGTHSMKSGSRRPNYGR